MRRPAWLAAGVVIGVGGTLWAEQRVKRAVRQAAERVSPENLALGALASAREVGDRVREAVAVGRQERVRREDELWREVGATPPDLARPVPPVRRPPGRTPGAERARR